MKTKIGIIPFIIRLRLVAFTIASLVGLYFMWDPVYFLYSLVAYFVLSTFGHDIGLHRYYMHQSFTVKNKLAESFIWVCSFLTGMSDPISYAKRHTWHHKYSDTELDNLHPVHHPWHTWLGYGILNAKGVDLTKITIAKSLSESKFHNFVNKHFFILYYSTLAVCFLIDFKLAFYILVVGSTLAHHAGSANSVINHRYGYRSFDAGDCSTNHKFFNYLTFGLGLHNNHHKFPYSYTTKIRPDETDIAGWFIKHVLASEVKEPKLK